MVFTGSKAAAKAAIGIAMTESREEEKAFQAQWAGLGIQTAAVDFGGEFNSAIAKIVERAVVAAKREHIIEETHAQEGAVAGAAHAAAEQILPQAFGLNVGGKIGIARNADHVSVAMFFGVGVIHLDDICIGFAHRAVS